MIKIKNNKNFSTNMEIKKRFDFRTLSFLNFMFFLIIWSFFGKYFEFQYGYKTSSIIDNSKLGIELSISHVNANTDTIYINNVIAGSAASLAGLNDGDRIIGINGVIITSIDKAVHLLTNHNNEQIKMTINRNGQNFDIYIKSSTSQIIDRSLKSQYLPFSKKIIVCLIFLKITIIMFILIYNNILNRVFIVLFFAGVSIFFGFIFQIYTPIDAFFAIKFNTIALLLGMGIISIILDQAGVFDYIAFKMYGMGNTSKYKITILCCIITYLFSLLVNNLTTILVIVPMTLNLAMIANFDPKPVIIGEIISSNLGGASTMVGDFPNMLISSEAQISFNEFIFNLMPVCLILFCALLLYLKRIIDNMPETYDLYNKNDLSKNLDNYKSKKRISFTKKERNAVIKALFVLFHVIFLFIISKKISINPSSIALIGGLSLFLFSGINKKAILDRIGFNDILFFIGLFIVVGGIEASGLVHYITSSITSLSFGNPWLLCLIIMWSSAFITSLLSAGPTTALFLPIVLGAGIAASNNIIWWSLSLGVLAGSSSSIIGATAGPVAISLLENFSSLYGFKLNNSNTITYKEFSKTGIPIMFIFLLISSVYILWLCLYLTV